jgi:hypothetical protein
MPETRLPFFLSESERRGRMPGVSVNVWVCPSYDLMSSAAITTRPVSSRMSSSAAAVTVDMAMAMKAVIA